MRRLILTTDMVIKRVRIEKLRQVLILMISMVQSPALTEKHLLVITNMTRMVQSLAAIVKRLPVTMNMINMVTKPEVIEQAQTELPRNTTTTEEKRVRLKKILQAELQNTINTAKKLGVINNV